MGGGLMQLVAYGARISTLRVTRRSLSSRLSTADTLTSRTPVPSGTCNFSRIDNAQLICSGGTGVTTTFRSQLQCPPYHDGKGGLAYSNSSNLTFIY